MPIGKLELANKSTSKLVNWLSMMVTMAPLTDETYHMCDEAFFKKMKNTALFVNVGRGPIVDT
ncbi:MAG: NAD(P)-dependent oxidoreductase, partial [Prevotella conceptionensis]